MSPENFEFITKLLYQTSGLTLGTEKAYLLENRLMPLVRRYELDSVEALVNRLRQKSIPGLSDEITEVMTTNESLFFRDAKPFEMIKNQTLPYLIEARAAKRKIRVWSAAASTGQESYSLAMVLAEEKAKLAGWKIEILGTDLSNEALNKAREGIYSQFEVQRGLCAQRLVKYFSKQGDKWQINSDIREMATFSNFNLLDDPSKFGTFDVIFCRNVLIYFDKETKAAVLNKLSRVLAPDGFLFLGAAETLLGLDTSFKSIEGSRGVYGLPQKAVA